MLRDRIKSGAEAGTAVVAKMQSGALVADDVVNAMVEMRLSTRMPLMALSWTATPAPWSRPNTSPGG